MKNILILCTGNSCRSQIAEGYFKKLLGNSANIYSAGVETHGVNPRAIKIMKEDNIDISEHTSDHVDIYRSINFDYVITVCDNAREKCPYFPSKALKIHQDFKDPAKAEGSEEEIMAEFRKVRDQIKEFTLEFVKKYFQKID